jgi:hypothetical protein
LVLVVSIRRQRLWVLEMGSEHSNDKSLLCSDPNCRISTSAFGIGQAMDSNQTPLGLHAVARKIGAGHPIGTVFRGRRAAGFTWQGQPHATIVHRILWLEGLEPGFNRGGQVDSFRRCIYLHGFGDEATLGRPASHGCIHLAAHDLIPLFDRVPVGTLVWISG